ncbi:MAG: ferric reductase-like transmembrane domain-containing protein [Bacteroidia bacterium]|nr:ferric reductase-like transmembrane domain-containing protein [Bacteroidia bacterium]
MGLGYSLVSWNKQKKKYDRIVWLLMALYLVLFASLTILLNPNTSLETLIIRAFGSMALIMLHIVLAIGPLTRLDKRFLPLLYNRRHLGVSMFFAALVHGVFSIIQFHALGNYNPFVSIFISNLDYASLTNFPFQVLGFLSLIVLFLMAATSHDFWLANLGAKTWKTLHTFVYLAYFMLIGHVFLGAFQQELSALPLILLMIGFVALAWLHLTTARIENQKDSHPVEAEEGWAYVCRVDEIENDRAKLFTYQGERIAVFKYNGKISAVNNVCRHQGGPLSEGKIIDGCITCPWHGYQYRPEDGQSPPPFTEKVETYSLKLKGNDIYIMVKAHDAGTFVEPLNCAHE